MHKIKATLVKPSYPPLKFTKVVTNKPTDRLTLGRSWIEKGKASATQGTLCWHICAIQISVV